MTGASMRHVCRTILVAGLLAMTAACGRNDGGQRPPPEVGVVTIEPQQAELQVELPGRTSPYATSQVRPQVSGIIQARLFKEGGKVVAGQPLYQIDPKPYQAAYDNAAATLATAKAKADRYAVLVKEKAIAGARTTDRAIRKNPYQTLGIVLGVGVIVGLLASGIFGGSSEEE